MGRALVNRMWHAEAGLTAKFHLPQDMGYWVKLIDTAVTVCTGGMVSVKVALLQQ